MPEVSATSDYGKHPIKYCSSKLWISEKNKNGKKLIDYVPLLMLIHSNHIDKLTPGRSVPNLELQIFQLCIYYPCNQVHPPCCCSSSLFPSTFPRIVDFSRELGLCIMCLEYDTLSLAIWPRINVFYRYDLSVCFLGYTWQLRSCLKYKLDQFCFYPSKSNFNFHSLSQR